MVRTCRIVISKAITVMQDVIMSDTVIMSVQRRGVSSSGAQLLGITSIDLFNFLTSNCKKKSCNKTAFE